MGSVGYEHCQHNGDDTGNANGYAAHGAFHIADLHGLGGAARMAAAADAFTNYSSPRHG